MGRPKKIKTVEVVEEPAKTVSMQEIVKEVNEKRSKNEELGIRANRFINEKKKELKFINKSIEDLSDNEIETSLNIEKYKSEVEKYEIALRIENESRKHAADWNAKCDKEINLSNKLKNINYWLFIIEALVFMTILGCTVYTLAREQSQTVISVILWLVIALAVLCTVSLGIYMFNQENGTYIHSSYDETNYKTVMDNLNEYKSKLEMSKSKLDDIKLETETLCLKRDFLQSILSEFKEEDINESK